jgi:TolB-like protein/Tfp pilus assembly protein PilF
MPHSAPSYQRLFAEMKRRRVFRVMAVYGALAFAVIEASDVVLPRMALPDWTVTLVVWLALLGFPVAIALAWAFDVTPGGLERTSDAAPGELTRILSAPASKRWPAGLLALVGVVAMVTGAWYVGRRSTQAEVPAATATAVSPGAGTDAEDDAEAIPVSESIAVLPFVNMSSDPEQEYFSDGISEEVLNLLAKIPELRVTSRSSAFSFKGQDLEIPEIAGRLHVAHVLEGSVRKSGDQVRITAQLIDARTDTHVWSQTWDRTLDDIFTIQDEIAGDVAEQLKVTLLGTPRSARPIDPEAYALRLQARQLANQFTAESIERSNDLYRQALEIDPGYARAWAGLAENYINQAGYGLESLEEYYERARDAAGRALAIDPAFAPAHANLGTIAMWYDLDMAAGARHMTRALELDPTNPEILAAAGDLLGNLGREEEAIEIWQYLIARDPANPSPHGSMSSSLRNLGRLDEARVAARMALSLAPGALGGHYGLGQILMESGEHEAVLAEMEAEVYEPYRLIGLSMINHALGRSTESDGALRQLIDTYAEGWAYNIAYVFAHRAEADSAFAWLEAAVEYHDAGLSEIAVNKYYLSVSDDPRWLPFLESIDMSPAQLASVEFEVSIPQ